MSDKRKKLESVKKLLDVAYENLQMIDTKGQHENCAEALNDTIASLSEAILYLDVETCAGDYDYEGI